MTDRRCGGCRRSERRDERLETGRLATSYTTLFAASAGESGAHARTCRLTPLHPRAIRRSVRTGRPRRTRRLLRHARPRRTATRARALSAHRTRRKAAQTCACNEEAQRLKHVQGARERQRASRARIELERDRCEEHATARREAVARRARECASRAGGDGDLRAPG